MKIINENLKFSGTLTARQKTDTIVLHHAQWSKASVLDVHNCHKGKGWAGIGYHLYIRKDGTVYQGRPIDAIGAHAIPVNKTSVGICCEGAYQTETMPEAQKSAVVEAVQYVLGLYPGCRVVGHREVDSTDCPGQNYPLEEIKNKVKGVSSVPRTVMKLPAEVYIQEIEPKDFEIMPCDCAKREISLANYFNCGYFAVEKGGKTIPVGNLASNGDIFAQAKENASWLNLAGHKLTTVYTLTDGTCGITKTDDLGAIRGLKTAVSGIPIIVGGKYVPMDEIKSEGYFGNELYDTWHGFLGIRHGKLVYAAMKCGFDAMCWAMVALGIYDAVKLDGGGSFILKNGEVIQTTSENRRIQNVGVWK